jgi:hypothetical protein
VKSTPTRRRAAPSLIAGHLESGWAFFHPKAIRLLGQHLTDILILKLGVFLKQFLAIGIQRREFHNAPDGQAHIPHARLSVHFVRVYCDAVQFHITTLLHVFFLYHTREKRTNSRASRAL